MKNLLLIAFLGLFISPLIGVDPVTAFTGLLVGGLIVHEISRDPSMHGVAFDTIPIVDGRGLFTKKSIAVYREKISPTAFLTSFFRPVESFTKSVSISVKRGLEKVAVDVHRYSDGNRNTFSVDSEKMFVPPFYDEYLTANEHQLYDVVISALSNGDTTFFSQMTAEIAEDVMKLREKIERAIEIQASQVFETGIVQLQSGTNIDFKRKAASLVAYSAAINFADNAVSPYDVIKGGATFIRQKGKSQGNVLNCILGSEALSALLDNAKVKERADIRRIALDSVREPQRNSVGASSHGEIMCGDYIVRLWSYPEYYDNASNVSTPYIHPKKIILLPEKTDFVLAFAAVPQLIKDGKIPQKGAYLIQDFMDEKRSSHEIHVKSAPITVPVAIDQIWTAQVISN